MTTENSKIQNDMKSFQQTIRGRLARVRQALRKHVLFDALSKMFLILLGMFFVSLFIDWCFELNLSTRFLLLFCCVVGLGYFLFQNLILPLKWPLPPLEVATLIDKSHHAKTQAMKVTPKVASVLELPHHMDSNEQSAAMIEQAVEKNFHDLEKMNFNDCINPNHWKICAGLVVGCLLLPTLFAFIFPSTAQLWANRWLMASDETWPRNTSLVVSGLQDGKLFVPRGETSALQIDVKDKADPTETVWLRLVTESGSDDKVSMTRFREGDFRYDIPPVQKITKVYAWGGDSQHVTFEIVPIDRPRIAALKLTAQHQHYEEPKVFGFTADEGNIRLLPQSKARIELTTSIPVNELLANSKSEIKTEWKQESPTLFSTSWNHEKAVDFQLVLKSADHELESHPRTLNIGIQPDRSPRVSFRYSGVRQRVTPQATIPLALTARDDFGVRQIDFTKKHSVPPSSQPKPKANKEENKAKKDIENKDIDKKQGKDKKPAKKKEDLEEANEDEEKETKVVNKDVVKTDVWYGPKKPTEEKTVDLSKDFELEALKLQPGQVVVFQSAIYDDCFTGTQKTDSRQLAFRVVKPDELFREILLRQQQLQSRLRKSKVRAEDLNTKLPVSLVPDDVSSLLRSHQLTKREVVQITRELEASVLEMKLNKIGGEETYQLISQTVLKPLNRVHQTLMEQQKQSLESLRSDEPDSLDKVMQQQQEIVDFLQKILDNMRQWDSFIDVVNQLNSIIKLERRVSEKTEELRKKQTDSLFD